MFLHYMQELKYDLRCGHQIVDHVASYEATHLSNTDVSPKGNIRKGLVVEMWKHVFTRAYNSHEK